MHSAAWNSSLDRREPRRRQRRRRWGVCGASVAPVKERRREARSLSPSLSPVFVLVLVLVVPSHSLKSPRIHSLALSLSRSLLSSPRVLPTPIHFAHAYILARQIFAGISNDRRLPRKFSPMWRSFTAFSASVSLTSTCPEEGRRRRGAGNSVPFLN